MSHWLLIALVCLASIAGCGEEHIDKRTEHEDLLLVAKTNANEFGGRYRGYNLITKLIHQRILANGVELNFASYLEDVIADDEITPENLIEFFKPSLTLLLGYNAGEGLTSEFRNAVPNAFNLLLWYTLLEGVAKDIAQVCHPDEAAIHLIQSDVLNPDFVPRIKRICHWSDEDARSDAALFAVWDMLMRGDASILEYRLFRELFRESSYKDANPSDVVKDMILAMTMNPNFLLVK